MVYFKTNCLYAARESFLKAIELNPGYAPLVNRPEMVNHDNGII